MGRLAELVSDELFHHVQVKPAEAILADTRFSNRHAFAHARVLKLSDPM
jgi:hypothetical protein